MGALGKGLGLGDGTSIRIGCGCECEDRPPAVEVFADGFCPEPGMMSGPDPIRVLGSRGSDIATASMVSAAQELTNLSLELQNVVRRFRLSEGGK